MGGARYLVCCNARQGKAKQRLCVYKRVDFFDGKKPVMTCKGMESKQKQKGWKEDKKPLTDFEPEEKGQEKL
jgi:hypothetical protein